MSQLLNGVRVLDLSNVLAGPFCGYQLALLGADVIKVEAPDGGDLARQLGADPDLNENYVGASFLAQNAGKRSVVLDLKSDSGKQAFSRLVESADVLIENFRPGVMDRLGVGYKTLQASNPRLIYAAISGFGQTGPLAHAPAYDQIIQGLSGLMSFTGDSESAPLRVGYPLCDTIGGVTAAFAICAALVNRSQSDKGAFLDVSMLDSTLVSMGWIVSNLLIAGKEPIPMGNENFTASPSGTFQCRDGLINISANQQQQFETLCDLIGDETLKTDPRFSERESRKEHRGALKERIEKQLEKKPVSFWEDVLNRAGVPAGAVLTVKDALSQPQVRHRDLTVKMDMPQETGREEVELMRNGFRINGEPSAPGFRPSLLGEHTEEVFRELGYAEVDLADLCKGCRGDNGGAKQ